MCTIQNKVGGETSKNPIPQTAHNAPQIPFTSDDWRITFLNNVIDDHESLEELFNLLHEVAEIRESIPSVGFISELFTIWANNPTNDFNAKRQEISLLFRLLARLENLREYFTCFNSFTDYKSEYQSIQLAGELEAIGNG
ncbi:hypothetical protein GCM10028805_25860 [Spirosoma harenae]